MILLPLSDKYTSMPVRDHIFDTFKKIKAVRQMLMKVVKKLKPSKYGRNLVCYSLFFVCSFTIAFGG